VCRPTRRSTTLWRLNCPVRQPSIFRTGAYPERDRRKARLATGIGRAGSQWRSCPQRLQSDFCSVRCDDCFSNSLNHRGPRGRISGRRDIVPSALAGPAVGGGAGRAYRIRIPYSAECPGCSIRTAAFHGASATAVETATVAAGAAGARGAPAAWKQRPAGMARQAQWRAETREVTKIVRWLSVVLHRKGRNWRTKTFLLC
jgi:ribosomal protein S27E